MVIELQKLPPLPSQQSPPPQNGRRAGRISKRSIPNTTQATVVQPVAVRRKPRNLIKDIVCTDEATAVPTVSATAATTITASVVATVEDEVINPISRLLRMQQAARKREPVYSVIEERGQQKRKEFVVEVECNGEKAQGIGSNKKLAKRMAAENFLIKMGIPKIESIEIDGAKAAQSGKLQRRVVFKEPEALGQAVSIASAGGSAGRQLVPGVLLMKSQENSGESIDSVFRWSQSEMCSCKISISVFKAPTANDGQNVVVARETFDVPKPQPPPEAPKQTAPAIETHHSSAECSPSTEPNVSANTSITSQPSVSGGIRPVDQLLYLAKLLKFEVSGIETRIWLGAYN